MTDTPLGVGIDTPSEVAGKRTVTAGCNGSKVTVRPLSVMAALESDPVIRSCSVPETTCVPPSSPREPSGIPRIRGRFVARLSHALADDIDRRPPLQSVVCARGLLFHGSDELMQALALFVPHGPQCGAAAVSFRKILSVLCPERTDQGVRSLFANLTSLTACLIAGTAVETSGQMLGCHQ